MTCKFRFWFSFDRVRRVSQNIREEGVFPGTSNGWASNSTHIWLRRRPDVRHAFDLAAAFSSLSIDESTPCNGATSSNSFQASSGTQCLIVLPLRCFEVRLNGPAILFSAMLIFFPKPYCVRDPLDVTVCFGRCHADIAP